MKTKQVDLNVLYGVSNNQNTVFDEDGYMYDLSIYLHDEPLKRTKDEAEELLKSLKESGKISIDDQNELHVIQVEFVASIKRLS